MYRLIRNASLGVLALSLVGIVSGCGVDRERNLDSVVSDSGSKDSSNNDKDVTSGDSGYNVTPDVGEDLGADVAYDFGVEELKAIACPDVQEEVGGPYRIDDANDEHDGWCLYTVRVHDFFRFDGCRSTGDIDEYIFDYDGASDKSYNDCFNDDIGFINLGEYEGSLRVFHDNPDGSYDYDVDSVLFRVFE